MAGRERRLRRGRRAAGRRRGLKSVRRRCCNAACGPPRAGGARSPAANPRTMHNRALRDTLAAFVEEAACQLAEEVSGGAEVPFELIEQGRRSSPLYCYRPLTGRFIA